ncbi:hypothetical protein HZB69_01035 [Candidatus Amesbacteria bacterium]|nr:hypothetical protein [Candidatus Amesbacteria bacterium]
MTIEAKKSGIPPGEYYENPYFPSTNEARDYSAIPLLPVEAHSILVDSAGKSMSDLDRLTLRRIAESDESDAPLDLKAIRSQVAVELGVDNEWE